MQRRQPARGHSIKVGELTYARLIIAAGEDGTTPGGMAEEAILAALDRRERQIAHQQTRDDWRVKNGTSVPKPMQQMARPSGRVTPKGR